MGVCVKKILTVLSILALLSSPALASGHGGGHGGGGGGHGSSSKEGGEKGEKESAEGGITGGRFEGDPIYVHIAPLVMPIINDEGVQQIVSLIFAVHVNDMVTAQKLRSEMPRINDALLRGLYGSLGDGDLRDGKMVSVVRVKGKALAAIREIMGADSGVADVLVQGVSQRVL